MPRHLNEPGDSIVRLIRLWRNEAFGFCHVEINSGEIVYWFSLTFLGERKLPKKWDSLITDRTIIRICIPRDTVRSFASGLLCILFGLFRPTEICHVGIGSAVNQSKRRLFHFWILYRDFAWSCSNKIKILIKPTKSNAHALIPRNDPGAWVRLINEWWFFKGVVRACFQFPRSLDGAFASESRWDSRFWLWLLILSPCARQISLALDRDRFILLWSMDCLCKITSACGYSRKLSWIGKGHLWFWIGKGI